MIIPKKAMTENQVIIERVEMNSMIRLYDIVGMRHLMNSLNERVE